MCLEHGNEGVANGVLVRECIEVTLNFWLLFSFRIDLLYIIDMLTIRLPGLWCWSSKTWDKIHCHLQVFLLTVIMFILLIKYPYFLLGWPSSLFSFFHEMTDTFFIFTNNFIDLDILSISAISPCWLLVGRGQGCC